MRKLTILAALAAMPLMLAGCDKKADDAATTEAAPADTAAPPADTAAPMDNAAAPADAAAPDATTPPPADGAADTTTSDGNVKPAEGQ